MALTAERVPRTTPKKVALPPLENGDTLDQPAYHGDMRRLREVLERGLASPERTRA